MKSIIRTILAIFLLSFVLTGCGKSTSEPEAQPSSPEGINTLLNINFSEWESSLPEKVELASYGEESFRATVTDPDQIARIISALRAVTVKGETDLSYTDSDRYLTFVFPDGKETTVSFENDILTAGGKRYETEGTEKLFALMDSAFHETAATPEPEPEKDAVTLIEPYMSVEGPSDTAGYQTVSSSRHGITFDVPDGWNVRTNDYSEIYLSKELDTYYTPVLPCISIAVIEGKDNPGSALHDAVMELSEQVGVLNFYIRTDMADATIGDKQVSWQKLEHPYIGSDMATHLMYAFKLNDKIIIVGEWEEGASESLRAQTDHVIESISLLD
ncbi:MAG: hypothetical protein IKE28_01720 [Solobacterium sp.]|nr:hypothetical protein [Solobacterium sp.]